MMLWYASHPFASADGSTDIIELLLRKVLVIDASLMCCLLLKLGPLIAENVNPSWANDWSSDC